MYTNHIVTITKKFIIDILNNLWFSDVVMFDNVSQFSDLSAINITYLDDNLVLDQRCAIFHHKLINCGCKCLISCIRTDDIIKSVCYRLLSINKQLTIDDKTSIRPFDNMRFDYSIADLHLCVKDEYSYSFYDNLGYVSNEQIRIFNLLKFIIGSEYISYSKADIFADVLSDSLSIPPSEEDIHYSPLYVV